MNAVIAALIAYPLFYVLPLNLIRFRWGFEEGLAPMPPEMEERADAADRLVLCILHVFLLVLVVSLMLGSPISAYEVGLTANNWKPALAMGVLFSLFPLGLSELVLRNIPPGLREKAALCGPVATWLGVNTLASFVHELWRAFCIISLIRLDLSAWVAALIVAVVYGTPHLHTSVAKALGSAVFGGAAGFLFVDTGSLLSPLTMSLIVSGVHLYQVRRRRTRHPDPPCPACGAIIRLSEVHRAADM
jgi:hypothetical protein